MKKIFGLLLLLTTTSLFSGQVSELPEDFLGQFYTQSVSTDFGKTWVDMPESSYPIDIKLCKTSSIFPSGTEFNFTKIFVLNAGGKRSVKFYVPSGAITIITHLDGNRYLQRVFYCEGQEYSGYTILVKK